MRIIRFNTPTGQVYIPASVVAENRTEYYSTVDGYTKGSAEWEEQMVYAESDNFECIDWLCNNMDFEDVEAHVVKVNDKVKVTDDDFWSDNMDFEMDDIEVSDKNILSSTEGGTKFGINMNIIPEECPICKNPLKIKENKSSGSIGLYCTFDDCAGTAVKKLQKGIEVLDIKGIGLSTCEKLNIAGILKIEDIFDKTKFNRMKLIESGEFKAGKSLEIIVNAVDKKDSLELKRIVNSLNITDVGSSVSEQVARMLAGLQPDFSNLNKDAIAKILDTDSDERKRLESFLAIIRDNQIDIIEPKELSSDVILFEMTGTPTPPFGKKRDFVDAVHDYGYVHHKLNKDCNLLVTHDITSTTGKMAKAIKLGIETKTYEQVAQDLGLI